MPYVTRNGRRMKRPAGATNSKQRLVALDGTVATFECIEGHHRMRHDYSKGPVSKRVGVEMLQKFASYWGLGVQKNGTKGHVYGWCQKCQDEFDGILKEHGVS